MPSRVSFNEQRMAWTITDDKGVRRTLTAEKLEALIAEGLHLPIELSRDAEYSLTGYSESRGLWRIRNNKLGEAFYVSIERISEMLYDKGLYVSLPYSLKARFTEALEHARRHHIDPSQSLSMPQINTLAQRVRDAQEVSASFETTYLQDILDASEKLKIEPARLTRKNGGEMICLRLETGTHPAFPYLISSLGETQSPKLGYQTLEDAQYAASDYAREFKKLFYVMKIEATVQLQTAPVQVKPFAALLNG